MRPFRIAVFAAVAALLVSASGVQAQGESIDEAREYIAKFVDINVLAATTYTYGTNTPNSGNLPYLPINKDQNSIALYNGFFQVSRHREGESFGFTFNMDIGETARYAGSDWDGDGATEGDFIEVREFFGTYKTPLAGITLKAGKFVSLLGYEVLLTNAAFNPTVSLGYLFLNVPYTHVGLMANIPLGEIAWLDIGVVNGWDNAVDTNNSKSLLTGFGVAPIEGVTTYIAGIYGSEACGQASTKCTALPAAGAGSKRAAVTWNASYTLPEETGLGLAIDSLYANESDILPDVATGNPFGASAEWYGLAGYVMWSPPVEELEGLSLNLRTEVFVDADGYRNPTGTTNPAVAGTPITVWEVSPTVAYQFTNNVIARLEYRYDSANKFAFEKDGGYAKQANTITAQVLVAF